MSTPAFSALPSCYMFSDGSFVEAGYIACFWSSSEDTAGLEVTGSAYYRWLRDGYTDAYLGRGEKGGGLAVRCLKD